MGLSGKFPDQRDNLALASATMSEVEGLSGLGGHFVLCETGTWSLEVESV